MAELSTGFNTQLRDALRFIKEGTGVNLSEKFMEICKDRSEN